MKNRIIAWWSGGIPSAVSSFFALKIFKNVEVVFVDTKNEHKDTYRFKDDCENIYGQEIITITREGYSNITQVWDRYLSLNHAKGAICSSTLKREVREKFQNLKTDYGQVFGFDVTERGRHLSMRLNYPEINAISPLVDLNYTKENCFSMVKHWGVAVPEMYRLGFRNNNCFKTGCVKGGVGYWQKMKREFPDKFASMAEREHRYSNEKGKPVTMIRVLRENKKVPCFLVAHPNFPECISIDQAKGREPVPLSECNGFCSTIKEEVERL